MSFEQETPAMPSNIGLAEETLEVSKTLLPAQAPPAETYADFKSEILEYDLGPLEQLESETTRNPASTTAANLFMTALLVLIS
jgi:hypothetical protein